MSTELPAPTQPPVQRRTPTWVWVLVGCFGGCILIVPILAAILFPVFAQARERARQTACLSNLKQLGTAVLMYSQDYDERFPIGKEWMDGVEPYVKNDRVFRCPSASQSSESDYGYAFNSELSQKAQAKIAKPDQTLMLFESTNLKYNAVDTASSLPQPGIHKGFNNVCYVNGTAKSVSTANR